MMRNSKQNVIFFALAVIGTALLVAVPESANGQFSGRRGFSSRRGLQSLLGRESVQTELKLTEKQIQQIEDSGGNRDQARELFRSIRGRMDEATTDEQRQAIRDEVQQQFEKQRQETESKLKAILSSEQNLRVQQLVFQSLGVSALAQDEVSADLKISEKQTESIGEMLEERRQAMRDLGFRASGEDRKKFTEEWDAKLLAALTPDQQQAWREKLGKPLESLQSSSRGERRGRRDRSRRSRREPNSEEDSSTTPTDTRRSSRRDHSRTGGDRSRTERPTTESAATGESRSSFSSAEEPSTQTGEPASASARIELSTTDKAPGERKLSFNFRRADWSDVLKLFADAAGLTLDLNDVPPGTFNYYDRRSYTPTEALDVLNGYLLQKGFVLVRRDRFLVVLDVERGIPPNLVPNVSVAELPTRGRNELLNVVFPVNDGVDSEQTAQEIESLLGPQGKVVALKSSNSLVVTDIGSNLIRIQQLLEGVAHRAGPGELSFRAYVLEHIRATDAERIVRSLLGLSPSLNNVSGGDSESRRDRDRRSRFESYFSRRSSRGDSSRSSSATNSTNTDPKSAKVTSDRRTNSLLVSATLPQLKIVDELIQRIDIVQDSRGQTLGADSDEPRLRVYEIESASATEVAKTLNALIPGVVVNEDGSSRRIHVFATPAAHREIEELVNQLDGRSGRGSVAVIPLARQNAVVVADSLRSLFASDGTSAPIIQADPRGRRLIVRGSAAQIAQVKTVLTQLGETGDGINTSAARRRGPVRIVPLGGRDPEEFVRLLEKFWSTTGRNPIRFVTPSKPIRKPREGENGRSVNREQLDERSDARPFGRPTRQAPSDVPMPVTVLEATQSKVLQDRSTRSRTGRDWQPTRSHVGVAYSDEPANDRIDARRDGAQQGDPIAIGLRGDNLVITSQDTKALDRLERMIESLTDTIPARNQWTVFYLRSIDATEAMTMLTQLVPSGGNAGTLVDSFTSNVAVGTSGRALKIVPDARSNALFVSGSAELLQRVEEVLKVLDASELPESLRDRVPRTIPVEHADVNQVAEIVRDVYQDAMVTGSERGKKISNSLANGSGAVKNGTGGRSVMTGGRLTLGVDIRTNRLVVSSNESLFREIESLVLSLDRAADEANRTVRVITLDNADSEAVQQALRSLLPKVKVTTASKPSSRARNGSTTTKSQDTSQPNAATRSQSNEASKAVEQRIRERFRREADGFRRGRENRDRSPDRGERRSRRGRDR